MTRSKRSVDADAADDSSRTKVTKGRQVKRKGRHATADLSTQKAK